MIKSSLIFFTDNSNADSENRNFHSKKISYLGVGKVLYPNFFQRKRKEVNIKILKSDLIHFIGKMTNKIINGVLKSRVCLNCINKIKK